MNSSIAEISKNTTFSSKFGSGACNRKMHSSQVIVQSDYLDLANNTLNQFDEKDIHAPGLLQLTGVTQHGLPTASGLNDIDYQDLSNISLGHKQLNQLQTVNKISTPTEILEHFRHIKCHCMMGLFPEIGRAWLTIDTEIYIWTYEQARDVAYYDGLNNLIVSVGLVKPRANVFVDDVKYLLILTTPIEIIILGVTFGDTTKTISSPMRSMKSTATFEEMQLMNKPIFVLSTDNVPMNIVKGSDSGRIFLGGRDGNLYEVSYTSESSWFGKRCKKINHSQGLASYIVPSFLKMFPEDPITTIEIDNSRNLLYLLTEKGAIEAWDISNDTIRRIARISENEIARSATNIMRTVDCCIFKCIKAICPLTGDDDANLHLIAVTQSGVRLYFSTTGLNVQRFQEEQQQQQLQFQQQQKFQQTQSYQQPDSLSTQSLGTTMLPAQRPADIKPQGLYLLHVRLPPGYTPNATHNKPKQVHLSHFCDGTLLLVSTPQQEQDLLWSISSSAFPHTSHLTESTTVMPLDGVVWSLAEVRDRTKAQLNSLLRKAQKPKKVVMLTNQGVHMVALLKPVDILQQLLLGCQGPHHEAVRAFFVSQTEIEACATCLLLACSEQYRGTDLAMWAAQAFMLYGGEPIFQQPRLQNQAVGRQFLSSTINQNNERNTTQMFISTPMPTNSTAAPLCRTLQTTQTQIPFQQSSAFPLSPISANMTTYGGASAPVNDISRIIFSAKHGGLYLYVARLLRPVWNLRCVTMDFCSSLSPADCAVILEDLYAIKCFLEANSVSELSSTKHTCNNRTFINGLNNHNQTTLTNPRSLQNEQQMSAEQPHVEEKRSLTALNYLIKHSCEVFSLWKILCEHQFAEIADSLTLENKKVLLNCTFRDLTLSHHELCATLIVTLINLYLKDNASVSSISSKLRDVCPNLYRHEDAVTFKATEILMSSKTCTNSDEKQEKLLCALQLCKDAAPNLPLGSICQQFTLANFYEGVIELAAMCANKLDPEQIGIHYYKSDEPAEDREGYNAYAQRISCYKEVHLMLDHIYQSSCNNLANQEMQNQLLTTTAVNNIEIKLSPNSQIMKIVTYAINIDDPLLHVYIYEWLMSHNMHSELLSLSEESLGEYLRRNVLRTPDNIDLIDLLWKYYEKNGHHAKAAHILDSLASTQSDNIQLVQRIEYLARAVMCMRNDSVGYSASNGILLKELEDKLEIARVQKTILEAVSSLTSVHRNATKAVCDLNRALYDITQLYQNFADPFELWECKLTILNCSHHNDPLLIESVWSNIINKAIEFAETPAERSVCLFTKIETLVKEFGESGHCFPLAFIIRELEVKACQLKLRQGAVPEKLMEMNIDIELLMEYYSRMISMNERVWANEGNEWHLVQSSICLVSILTSTSNAVLNRSRRRVVGKAQDIISVCLNLCYQRPGTESLQQTLKELQCRLQRCSTS